MNRSNGFTLVELMVALTVLAILIAVGIPGFNQFVQGQRTATQVNDFIAAVNLARSEALSRGRPAGLRSMDGDFNTGFQLWLDGNSDGDYVDPEDELLRDYEPVLLATLTVSADPLNFLASGWLGGAYQVTVLANNCKQQNNRTINITRTGGVEVIRNNCP
ncbi:MAG: GspH/FimT family pseudopilin [Pseudomonadota bacterium]